MTELKLGDFDSTNQVAVRQAVPTLDSFVVAVLSCPTWNHTAQ